LQIPLGVILTNLLLQIEKLIDSKASDFQIAKLIKQEIKQYLNSLNNIFTQSSGKDFFVKHTKKIDEFIKIIYKYLLRKHFGIYIPLSNSIPITIVALGSYGREQLCVYSDIDIMVIFDSATGYNTIPIIEEFMTLSWDSGLKLGSRVHHIDDINEAVKDDITIKTAILESRFIYGSKQLWTKFLYRLKTIRNTDQKYFITQKIDEHNKRLNKYPLTMQPNIKDGYGGIRESNMLFWVANITYGVSNTKELVNILFTDEEYKTYRISLEYIFKVRNALHLIARKKLDQVTFDILPELSSMLGFTTKSKLTKERLCISKLISSLHNIHYFTSVMTRKITRKYFVDTKSISCLRQNRLSKNIYNINNIVYISFYAKPKKLNNFLKELNSFKNIQQFDISYIYYAHKTILPKVLNGVTKSLLLSLFYKPNLYAIIKLLHNANLLNTLIPTLKKITNQPQFDGFHKHPVDIHSIKTLYHIENIRDDFILDIYNNLTENQKLILKLSALFHDCGKGRGKDHHIAGQNLFRKFAKSMKLDDDITNIVSTLIRYHNMMNKIATTEDIYSQNTILYFTGVIQTAQNLKLLYILTYADINSVNSKLYKSMTSTLLKELYLQSLPAFENKELVKISTRRVLKENTIKKSKLFLTQPKALQKKILNIKSNQIFLKYKAQDIINIAKTAYNTTTWDYEIINENRLTIRITRATALNLGYLLGKMQFLNIISMGIYKLFDNKKFFEISFDDKLDQTDILFVEVG
jgi:[protein-PII] uridylyltransferase